MTSFLAYSTNLRWIGLDFGYTALLLSFNCSFYIGSQLFTQNNYFPALESPLGAKTLGTAVSAAAIVMLSDVINTCLVHRIERHCFASAYMLHSKVIDMTDELTGAQSEVLCVFAAPRSTPGEKGPSRAHLKTTTELKSLFRVMPSTKVHLEKPTPTPPPTHTTAHPHH